MPVLGSNSSTDPEASVPMKCTRLMLLAALGVGSVSFGPCQAASPAAAIDSVGQVLQREREYSTALLHGDAKALAKVLADSFVDTSESGKLRDKRELLAIIAHQTPPAAINEAQRKIQIYGDAAVVTVRFEIKGMDKGKPYDASGRATDVWIRRNGGWYCVAAHSSAIN